MGKISDDRREEVHSADHMNDLNEIFFIQLKSRLLPARQDYNIKLTIMVSDSYIYNYAQYLLYSY